MGFDPPVDVDLVPGSQCARSEVGWTGIGHVDQRKASVLNALLHAFHGQQAVHGHVACQESCARPFQDMEDIHALTHEIGLEHPVRAAVGLAPLRRCPPVLPARGLISQVVVHDHRHVRVGSGSVNEVIEADPKRIPVAHGQNESLLRREGDTKPPGDGIDPAVGAGKSIPFPGAEGLPAGATDRGPPHDVFNPQPLLLDGLDHDLVIHPQPAS